MQEHDTLTDSNEPEGGWVSAPTLLTSPIAALALCKFSGMPIGEFGCMHRRAQLHSDEACITVYAQAEMMIAGQIDNNDLTSYVTTVSTGGERTFRTEVPA
jgi:hypothetical protein